jgi:adenine-specific DNA-methyltransferase
MKKIDANEPMAQTADLVAGNIAQLKALFPEIITEGADGTAVNVDVLKQLVGDKTVTGAEEKYGLNWHGKRKARQLALTPSLGTLRPCPEDSVDWDTTQNLMIEGDNLEVLKLLQKSYAGKVKLIYIDPPYNTGKDFVYPDNFQDNIKNYLELTGQVEGGTKITSNTESSGRFHTDWLNMMYPRLKLARNLLRDDGVIFISIDDGELENLRKVCGEIFGEENFVVQIIWRKRSTPPNDKVIGANHDYILCYARDLLSVGLNLKERSKSQVERYQNPDNHPKGPWAPGDLMANVKGGRYVKSLNYPIVNPLTNEQHFPGSNGNWRFSANRIQQLLANNEIWFGEDGKGKPKLKRFLCDVKEGVSYASVWDFVPLNTSGSNEMRELFNNPTVFESPKPVGLIEEMLRLGSTPDGVVLDFFGGSGSTGHATYSLNAKDNGVRKYIVVQLPEATSTDSEAYKAGYKTIAELTKERLRRAAKKIKDENPLFAGDLGFRVFKLDSTNIREWEPQADDLEGSMQLSIEHLKKDRSEADILYELLLKLGLDLCVPIQTKNIAGLDVHSVGGGVLIACLSEKITRDDVEALGLGIVAWRKELHPAGDTTCVFRDHAFADDVTKTNLAAILQQHGIETVRSL